jgi:ribA/ribD-fused uncharacterized protein
MITRFRGQYGWLSNFADVLIERDSITYSSVERAYMSAKSDSPEWKEYYRDEANYIGDIKRKSRHIQLILDWDNKREEVMFPLLFQKYTTEPFYTKLISTDDMYISEGNYHGDKYWGVCLKSYEGDNRLGKMIMEIREYLKYIF